MPAGSSSKNQLPVRLGLAYMDFVSWAKARKLQTLDRYTTCSIREHRIKHTVQGIPSGTCSSIPLQALPAGVPPMHRSVYDDWLCGACMQRSQCDWA